MAKDNHLSEMEAAFLSLPLRSGYPYKYWTKGVDCTLVKKANSYRVAKLRTNVLFEADFNFINKAVSRKLAKQADQNTVWLLNNTAVQASLSNRTCIEQNTVYGSSSTN